MSSSRRGFTLVELSIVLVILGLLTGGIVAGRSLVRASALRAVITQYDAHVSAVESFKQKYAAFPGDMTNAQFFWGVAHATPATCATTATGIGTATCNGDGDGRINPAAAGSNEVYRFWQHLSNAGLIDGRFTGVTDGSSNVSSSANNSPRGKLRDTLWFAYYWDSISGNSFIFDGVYNNSFAFGMYQANTWPATMAFRPEELWNIDSKMDDGKPATGKLVVGSWGSCTNASTYSDFAANYLLNSMYINCVAIFPQVF